MLTAPKTAGQHPAVPLTHRQCVAAGVQQAIGGANGARLWVQVRRYHPQGPYVLCGQVVELRENGAEWFKVDTAIGSVWADGQHLRLCSGDGRCTCETVVKPAGAPDESAESTSGATNPKIQQPCGLQPGCDGQPSGQTT